MAVDVNKPSSSDYPTKPTSQASTPPCRDHQHNNNQTIPTIPTKDRPKNTHTQINTNTNTKTNSQIPTITAKDQQHHVIDTHAIGIPLGLFDIPDDTTTTTVTITENQDDFYKMTLEEQMQHDEHYAAEDRAEKQPG